MKEALVVFTPSGRRSRVELGTTILSAARSLGVDLDSVCGGRGICTRCQCDIGEGSFPKHGIVSTQEHLSEPNELERQQHALGSLSEGRRLGCAAQILGDVVVDIPPESQVHRQVIRKAAESRDIELHPVSRLYYVEVPEPDMHDPSGDLQRLQDALEFEWGLSSLTPSLSLLQLLQRALRVGGWSVTVAIRGEREMIALWPGYQEKIYGIAVDVGSTTIAAHLCVLHSGEVLASAGMMNPQIHFGEDLMSRVSYVMMHPDEGARTLTQAVREALAQLVDQLTQEAGVESDKVLELTLVGNPVMHHLVLGISPIELGGAPFALATDEAVEVSARDLGLSLVNASMYCLPCVAGHVGADTAAVILSSDLQIADEVQLLVDIGTNAEIVLGNSQRLLACSSPTGPAFEGAQISAGQRAALGAIERVRIDPLTLEPRFKVIGCEYWSDHPAFLSEVKAVGISGLCGSGIIEAVAEMFLARIVSADGVIEAANMSRSSRILPEGRTYAYQLHLGDVEVRITQGDIRAIQLAKAALFAGCQLLMDRMGIKEVDVIRLAGAFGSHIDVKYAMVLGLLPDCALERVSSVGNAAGTGARIALLDEHARRNIEQLVRRVEKVETAVEPEFQKHFVDAMVFPHRTCAYSKLRERVVLPPPSVIVGESSAKRRSSRRRLAKV